MNLVHLFLLLLVCLFYVVLGAGQFYPTPFYGAPGFRPPLPPQLPPPPPPPPPPPVYSGYGYGAYQYAQTTEQGLGLGGTIFAIFGFFFFMFMFLMMLGLFFKDKHHGSQGVVYSPPIQAVQPAAQQPTIIVVSGAGESEQND